jgi:hypothetical protein
LIRSAYIFQGNDFFLLKPPKDYIELDKDDILFRKKLKLPKKVEYIPVDAPLKNLVLYLWKHKLITLGWDKGYDGTHGYITFKLKTTDRRTTLDVLRELIGGVAIYVHSKSDTLYGKDLNNYISKLNKRHRKQSYVIKWWDFIVFSFDKYSLKMIHKRLKIPIPDISKALMGSDKCLARYY